MRKTAADDNELGMERIGGERTGNRLKGAARTLHLRIEDAGSRIRAICRWAVLGLDAELAGWLYSIFMGLGQAASVWMR
jgi:hypothetical protein